MTSISFIGLAQMDSVARTAPGRSLGEKSAPPPAKCSNTGGVVKFRNVGRFRNVGGVRGCCTYHWIHLINIVRDSGCCTCLCFYLLAVKLGGDVLSNLARGGVVKFSNRRGVVKCSKNQKKGRGVGGERNGSGGGINPPVNRYLCHRLATA